MERTLPVDASTALAEVNEEVASEDRREKWLRGRVVNERFEIASSRALRDGYPLRLIGQVRGKNGYSVVSARISPDPLARVVLVVWLVIALTVGAVVGILSIVAILTVHGLGAELLWFVFIIGVMLLPLVPVLSAVREAERIAQWFDRRFPGEGSLWP